MSRRLANAEDLAEFNAEHPSDPEAMARVRKQLADHVPAKRRLPDGTLEKTRAELEAEVERLLCENYALKAGASYVTECERLRFVLERIAGATMSQYASVDDMARGIKRIAREALDYGED